jgi:hypothetical protein
LKKRLASLNNINVSATGIVWEAALFDFQVMGDELWERFNGGTAGTR